MAYTTISLYATGVGVDRTRDVGGKDVKDVRVCFSVIVSSDKS